MQKRQLMLLLFGFFTAMLASGTTIVPLNTGYNHAVFAPYPTFVGATSTISDNYWINIASYPTTAPAIGPSWVLDRFLAPWFPAISGSHWISAWRVVNSPPGTQLTDPAYTIFRKCFCLLPNFRNASFSFRVRADDKIQVWFNTQTQVALAPAVGNWNFGPQLVSLPSQPGWFRPGRNCLYVLLEDTGGHMGFNLQGTIQADGLAPLPAFGTGQVFDCPCRGALAPSPALKSEPSLAEEDQEILRQLLEIAEARRLRRAQGQRVE